MLHLITMEQLTEWQIYDELEPFGPQRLDYNFAAVVQALWNIARDVRRFPTGWPLDDFLLHFGDSVAPVKTVVQTVEQQEFLLDAWMTGSNLAYEASIKHTKAA